MFSCWHWQWAPSSLSLLIAGCIIINFLEDVVAYDLVREYGGSSFFDGWDFYGSWDNLTLGDTWWVNKDDAFMQGLAYVNGNGNAIIKVDNTTDVSINYKRNAVRITTSDFYDFGSLWIIDLVHVPYGCSVWPAFWSFGANWPFGGEIDILEAINLMTNNQMALHTIQGCQISSPSTPQASSGQQTHVDCSLPSGCTILDTRKTSYGATFAQNGGGVWATQFDVSGIYIWFWPRDSVPPTINTLPLDISTWGPPTGSYPNSSTCPVMEFFTPQQLVLDIALCGDWAGIPSAYSATCGNTGSKGSCYLDSVVGPGSSGHYDNAYFEISYVKAFTTSGPAPTGQPASALHSSAVAGVQLNPGSPIICFILLLSAFTVLSKFLN